MSDRPGLTPPTGRARFLERKTYRRARLEDAARLLPVLGLFLFFSPIAINSGPEGLGPTATWLMYLMGVWLILIGLAALLARKIGPRSGD